MVHGALSDEGLKFILRTRFAAAGLASALSPHSLRHSFITLALRGGAGLPMVQSGPAPRQPADHHALCAAIWTAWTTTLSTTSTGEAILD